jgi:hypothetical protein
MPDNVVVLGLALCPQKDLLIRTKYYASTSVFPFLQLQYGGTPFPIEHQQEESTLCKSQDYFFYVSEINLLY